MEGRNAARAISARNGPILVLRSSPHAQVLVVPEPVGREVDALEPASPDPIEVGHGVESDVFVEFRASRRKHEAFPVERFDVTAGQGREGRSQFRGMRRGDEEPARREKLRNMREPGVLRRLVEVREHGHGEDYVEGAGREARRGIGWDIQKAARPEMRRCPANRRSINVDADQCLDGRVAQEVAAHSSRSAAKIEPTGIFARGFARALECRHDVGGGDLPDSREFAPIARLRDPTAQPSRRQADSGASKEVFEVLREVADSKGNFLSRDPRKPAKSGRQELSDRPVNGARLNCQVGSILSKATR